MDVGWVRLKRYCEITGESRQAVHKRRYTGKWIEGKHCKLGPDGRLWINLPEAQSWVNNGSTSKENSTA